MEKINRQENQLDLVPSKQFPSAVNFKQYFIKQSSGRDNNIKKCNSM